MYRACMLDVPDNQHKGLFKESLGNVNDMINVRLFDSDQPS